MNTKPIYILLYLLIITFVSKGQSFPNDTYYSQQWYLQNIQVEQAWGITKGSPSIKVAIIDAGINWNHQELGPVYNNIQKMYLNPGEEAWNPWNNPSSGNGIDSDQNGFIDDRMGWDFYHITQGDLFVSDNNPTPNYSTWPYYHGTAISGIIAAKTNNGDFIAGIAGGDASANNPGVLVIPIKIMDKKLNTNQSYIDFYQLGDAIKYAVDLGANVINISFGGDPDPHYNSLIQQGLDYAYSHNVAVVVSSGNSNSPINSVPALLQNVIRVGATDADDMRWEFSSYGASNKPLDLVAPGVLIPMLTNDDAIFQPAGSNTLCGTSYSAAMVSATIGLMLSVNQGLNPDEIRQILRESSDKVNPLYYTYTNGYNDYMGYGRLNTYQAVCMAISEMQVNTITSLSQTWNTPRYSGNIVIEQGKTLTISTTVYMNPGSKIVIEPGGLLILDNAILTNCPVCGNNNQMWKGIEVWGDRNSNQLVVNGQCAQGRLIIRNQSLIEHAEIGVLLAARNSNGTINTTKTGGILKVENDGNSSTYGGRFLNNEYAIRFVDYHHFMPNTSIEIDNVSSISDCLFNINTNYLGADWYYSHIHLYSVKGVRVEGCVFQQSKDINPRGHAINSWGAGFKVTTMCHNPSISPCPEYYQKKNFFTNFSKAVNIVSTTAYPSIIDEAVFSGNSKGVALNNVLFASITRNSFSIGKATASEEQECDDNQASGFGIFAENLSRSFTIEENAFSKLPAAPSGNYTGIYISNSETFQDNIYKNSFQGLSYGNFSDRKNRPSLSNDAPGLKYYCNTNSGNAIDFIVTGTDARIGTRQGNTDKEAGNTFSTNAQWHFLNQGTQQINYYYHNNPPVLFLPDFFDAIYVSASAINTCPSNFSGGGGSSEDQIVLGQEEELQRELCFAENLQNYNNICLLYDSYKDGGNTQSLMSDVQTSLPQDMWAMRSNLLGISPHLSMEVLKTVSDRTDVFPDPILLELLSANPDELKSGELIDYLENKQEPLPAYMIEVLHQVASGTTYKTALIEQMETYSGNMLKAAKEILRSHLNKPETDFETVRNWFDNIGGMESDMGIVETYISENDFQTAQTILNMIPTLYGLQGNELTEYNEIKLLTEMRMNWKAQDRDITSLNDEEIGILSELAGNEAGKASIMARGILSFVFGTEYCNCLPATGANAYKKSRSVAVPVTKSREIAISVSPNPAQTWVQFDYHLPVFTDDARIVVTDVNGKPVQEYAIRNKTGQFVWNTTRIPAGTYIYSIVAGKQQKSGRLIIN